MSDFKKESLEKEKSRDNKYLTTRIDRIHKHDSIHPYVSPLMKRSFFGGQRPGVGHIPNPSNFSKGKGFDYDTVYEPPNIEKAKKDYIYKRHSLYIRSSERNIVSYSNPYNYKIELPTTYKNIVAVEITNLILPKYKLQALTSYLLLNINELGGRYESNNTAIKNAFSRFDTPDTTNLIQLINNSGRHSKEYSDHPIPSIRSLTIQFQDDTGSVYQSALKDIYTTADKGSNTDYDDISITDVIESKTGDDNKVAIIVSGNNGGGLSNFLGTNSTIRVSGSNWSPINGTWQVISYDSLDISGVDYSGVSYDHSSIDSNRIIEIAFPFDYTAVSQGHGLSLRGAGLGEAISGTVSFRGDPADSIQNKIELSITCREENTYNVTPVNTY